MSFAIWAHRYNQHVADFLDHHFILPKSLMFMSLIGLFDHDIESQNAITGINLRDHAGQYIKTNQQNP